MTTLAVTWLGHAAFLLEGDGLRVLLDPYRTPDVGRYDPINTPADIVLVSHLNPKYHSHWEAGSGQPVHLNGLDFAGASQGVEARGVEARGVEARGVEARGVRFQAVPVWESPKRDVPVSMPYFSLGGITVCHSGDLGHALSAAEAAPIQGVDVFLAVAGGPPTVPLPDLKATIDLVKPRIVIPMHYQNGKVNLNLQPVDDFLALFSPSQIIYSPSPTLEVSPEALPKETQVVVLPSAR